MKKMCDCGHLDTKRTLVDGSFLCEECFRKLRNKWYCSSCHEWHHNKFLKKHPINYGSEYSCDCLPMANTYMCNKCNGLFTANYGEKYQGGWYCRCCIAEMNKENENKVNGYYYTPIMRTYYSGHKCVNGIPDDFKGVGIELEVDQGGEVNSSSELAVSMLNKEVYCKHDGSLYNGFEIVTFPHTTDSITDLNWEELFKALICRGYRSHDSNHCGLHMHFSRTMFTREQVIYLIYFFEKNWNDLLKFSRRDSDHADRWASRYLIPTAVSIDSCAKIYDRYNNRGNHSWRYHAVNLQKKGTIEFRLMRGTLNYKTFMATLDFLMTIVRNSANITPENINDNKVWFKGLKLSTMAYMKRRGCFGYTNKNIREDDDLCA